MHPKDPRIQLIRAVGTSLHHFYVLVNVEVEFQEWRTRILEWDGSGWRCVYRDPFDFSTDCTLLSEGTIVVDRMDGSLVIVDEIGAKVWQTHQESGFALRRRSNTSLLLAGNRLSGFDCANGSEVEIYSGKRDWSRISDQGVHEYVVGLRGQIARVEKARATLIESPTRQNLTAIYTQNEEEVIIGGWQGLVQRCTGDKWDDISVRSTHAVTGLAVRDSMVVACLSGVYTFDETKRVWRCEIEPSQQVWSISVIGGNLLACHTYSGLISIWDGTRWQQPLPSVQTTSQLS